MVVKSCKKCRIRYPFNGTKDFALFEESESLVCNRSNDECDSNDFREFLWSVETLYFTAIFFNKYL